MNSFGIKPISPDDFLTELIDLNHEKALEAFNEMVLNKKNPAMTQLETLSQMRKVGLLEAANA